VFDNGIKVYKEQLIDVQLDRYQINNLHEPEEEIIFLNALANIPNDGVFVNIGAAIGYYPLLAKRVKPLLKIFAYEPLKKHRKYFSQNIKLNNYRKNDFTIFQTAVSTIAGNVEFKKLNYGSTITDSNSKKNFLKEVIELLKGNIVKSVSLEQVLEQVGGTIDLMQMDIQGYEGKLLESGKSILTERKIRKLLVGTHGNEIHEKCQDVLSECHYKIVCDICETKLQPDGIIMGEK